MMDVAVSDYRTHTVMAVMFVYHCSGSVLVYMIDTTTGSMQLSHKLELTPKHYPGITHMPPSSPSSPLLSECHSITVSFLKPLLPLVVQTINQCSVNQNKYRLCMHILKAFSVFSLCISYQSIFYSAESLFYLPLYSKDIGIILEHFAWWQTQNVDRILSLVMISSIKKKDQGHTPLGIISVGIIFLVYFSVHKYVSQSTLLKSINFFILFFLQ